jgi:hypothetical protein
MNGFNASSRMLPHLVAGVANLCEHKGRVVNVPVND